jgi:SAM-dependent methyltransferase
VAEATVDLAEFERRLADIERVFAIDSLHDRGRDLAEVERYFVDSSLGYRLLHTTSGAMHMALNPDGVFDESGYLGQAAAVEALLGPHPGRVLELACGKGFNSYHLAARLPDVEFVGTDLVRSQLDAAHSRAGGLTNVRYLVADFHRLPFADESFDLIFAVEGLVHALDVPRSLAEAARCLRPNGRLIVVDAWRTEHFDGLPLAVRKAAVITELSMAVTNVRQIGEWLSCAECAGFVVTDDRDLTYSVMPNLRRLERIAAHFLRYPRLARLAARAMPLRLAQNSISCYLMPLTVEAGAYTYRLVGLTKN